MILHIVRSGETITKIADNYQVEVADITSNNFHITDFKNLRPGMKLKIPFISVPVIETLEETETFISDYYPSLNSDFNKDNLEKEETNDEVKDEYGGEIKEEIPMILDSKEDVIEEKKEVYEPHKAMYSNYQGHLIPNIDQKYIRKI